MKGRISNTWRHTQRYYYGLNLDTRLKKYFTIQAWTKSAIKTLINMGLGMCGGRCNVLHGRTEDVKRKIKRDKALNQVMRYFEQQNRVT